MSPNKAYDNQKFPPTPMPPEQFDQSQIAEGITVNQYYGQNPYPYPVMPPHMHPRIQRSAWTTDLCCCFEDMSNCCMTCWCPCITFGRISEIVDQGTSTCVSNTIIYTLITLFTGGFCTFVYSCHYRSKLRSQLALKTSCCCCPDCIAHCCCEPCALCQEYRELQNHGFNVAIGWQGNVDLQNQIQGVRLAPMVHPGMIR